ncbi:ribosome biogenesis protein C1orf109 homolog isoform X2 [Bombina bombina]|uniref:ribosome biogenesis protein C1orf109 homolog isoform X2 n=1 Tax=Bombina bombina TaxID=8345 RepID=UPI00235B13BE|nr:ribosome biogenesis protein C1orf109 homolog isoform X2 [Bombina bombina]
MTDQAAIASVHQSLRKCFDVIEQQEGAWQLALQECEPLLSTLSNLAEQLLACQKVSFSNTALSIFPDLQECLHYKLEGAMEATLENLNDKILSMQKVKDAVSHHVGSVFYVYEVNADKIGLEASLERSAISPSIADMLEWLQNIEKHYRNQMKLLLQVRSDCLAEIQALPQTWGKLGDKSPSIHQLVEDTLLNVAFFRENT